MYIVSIFLHTRQAQRTKGTRPLARWRSVVVLIVYVYLLHIVLFIDRYFILCCALEGILWGFGSRTDWQTSGLFTEEGYNSSIQEVQYGVIAEVDTVTSANLQNFN